MPLFDALLADFPATFARDPDTVLVWQIGHPAGLTWTVTADNALIVTVGGGPATSYPLHGRTLTDLGAEMTAAGIQTLYIHPEAVARDAAILHPASGSTPDDRPASLHAYRNLLRAHVATLATALDGAESALSAALAQLLLPDATAHWADYWGRYFGVSRDTGEADSDYTQRIIDEVFRARNTARSIENNVRRYAGYTVDIKEPWRNMWTLNRSRLDGFDDALPGEYHRYHIIHPIAREEVNWPDAMPVIEADRPAGTLIWPPSYRPPGDIIPVGDGLAVIMVHSHLWQRKARLTGYVLDATLVLNGTAPIRAPRTQCGHWHPDNSIATIAPDLGADATMTREVTAEIIIFDRNVVGGWRGAWNEQTWEERSAAAAIPVKTQHSTET